MGKKRKKSKPELDANVVRGALIARGTTLTHWARNNGYHWNTVFSAVKEGSSGPKGSVILRKLREELGL